MTRVCLVHRVEIGWREIPHQGHQPVEEPWCPAGPHACSKWGVQDARGSLVAIGSPARIVLLDGFEPLRGYVLPSLLQDPPKTWGRANSSQGRRRRRSREEASA